MMPSASGSAFNSVHANGRARYPKETAAIKGCLPGPSMSVVVEYPLSLAISFHVYGIHL